MENELLDIFARLSPSNQRLVRELIWKLCQLEQLAIPEDHDARLDYAACCDRWLEHLVTVGFSQNTVALYTRYVRWLLMDYPHPTKAHIDAYFARMVASGRKPSTLGSVTNAIKSFFAFLLDEDIAKTNPADRLHAPQRELEIRRAPRPELVQQLLDAEKKPRHQLMLMLMVDCGLRLSEVARARVDLIDLDSQLIIVLGKKKKQRQAPFSAATAGVIKGYLQELKEAGYPGPWLFPGVNPEKPAALRSIDGYMAALCQRLGIQPITPHHLRHYFATQMLSHGANLKATSAILGHSSPSTTANVYWHLIDQQEVIEQHLKYGPLQQHLKGFSHAETMGE